MDKELGDNFPTTRSLKSLCTKTRQQAHDECLAEVMLDVWSGAITLIIILIAIGGLMLWAVCRS